MAIVLFLLLLSQGLLPRAHGNECKRQTSCNKDKGPAIRFPFWQMVQQPADCGYGSGFGLSCSQSPEIETWLELPLSVKVQKIDFGQQEIDVVNPNKCFPSLNLSSSPFQFSKRFVKSYSLFSCPSPPLTSLGQQVTCLSSPGHLVYAIPSDDLIEDRPLLSCVKMYDIPSVPKGIFDQENSVLSWSEPDCSHNKTECLDIPEGTLCYIFRV